MFDCAHAQFRIEMEKHASSFNGDILCEKLLQILIFQHFEAIFLFSGFIAFDDLKTLEKSQRKQWIRSNDRQTALNHFDIW